MLSNNDLVYFDNAGTTLKPDLVVNAINEFYTSYTSNIFRGTHRISEIASMKYTKVRSLIALYVNANYDEIIFTYNCTDSINMLAQMLNLKPEDKVICSILEHHSNYLPWGNYCNVIPIGVDKKGILKLDELEQNLDSGVKVVTLTMASNVTGNVQPIEQAVNLCKKKNVLLVLDASQMIGHRKIDVKRMDVDFMVFSAHKMMGPSGVGILYGRAEQLNKLKPARFGGGMVNRITDAEVLYKEIPYCFESGTPAIENVIGYGGALEFVMETGIENIAQYMERINRYMYRRLIELDFIYFPFPIQIEDHVPIFTIRPKKKSADVYYISRILSDTYNIALNVGYQCCQPFYHNENVEGAIRVSLYIYNTMEEVDYFIESLKKIRKLF